MSEQRPLAGADSATSAVLLVGHGGIAKGTPREWISEQRRLEAERRSQGTPEPSARERELDEMVRNFPRPDAAADPYRAGLESVGERLRQKLGARQLKLAYNEFCAPSVERAIDDLVRAQVTHITILTTMVTPGGSHSEVELPEIVGAAQLRHAHVRFRYVWPYDVDALAGFFALQALGSE